MSPPREARRMERDEDQDPPKTPPDGLDIDEGLDPYDEELAESFPASDPPSSIEP